MSLSEEAPKGRLAGLIALRERLAIEIDTGAQARDIAALSRQFSDVLLQIDELSEAPADSGRAVSPLDELRRKRAEKVKTG